MSASASQSGTDTNARKETAVKAEMESEVKKTHVPTKIELRTGLKNWSASSVITLTDAESERQYKHPKSPEWVCIICSKLINRTPVYQCQTGHLACSSCSQKGINCHSCSKAVSRIRNLAVENMINSLVVTCKFSKLGCNHLMKFETWEHSKHEDKCSFKPMFCPMPGCKHVGVKKYLPQHLISDHGISFMVDVGKSTGVYTRYLRGSLSDHEDSEDFEDTKEFDLDSSTALVMLRNSRSQEFHLLHHQCTAMGDRVQITALAKTCKRKYKLVVKVSKELKYCYESSSTSNLQPAGGLLIPRQSDGATLKKRCIVTMP